MYTWKALKEYSGKQIYDLDDQDILDYLLFKDSNKSGRTVVHFKACPFIGATSLENCSDSRCSLRHTANSMRIGIVLKLRKAFEEVRRRGPMNHLQPWETLLNLFSSRNT